MKLLNTFLTRFTKQFFAQLLVNGKLLVGYLLTQIPNISTYPGLITAAHDYALNQSDTNMDNLLVQLFMLGAAGHRFAKVLIAAKEDAAKAPKK